MRSSLVTLLAVWAAICLAPFASAQERATAKLFARQLGDQVQAAVQFQVDRDWYLYHTEIDPDGFGLPLKFQWSGPELAWSDPLLPEPKSKKIDDPNLGSYTDYYHDGTFVAWFHATGNITLDDLRLTVKGQTCSSIDGMCILFQAKDLQPASGIPADFWSAAPAAMQAVQGGADGARPAGGADTGADVPDGANTFGWVPTYDGNIDLRYRVEVQGEKVRGIIQIDVEEGFHAYHGPNPIDLGTEEPVGLPTTVEFDDNQVTWGELVYPKPHIEKGIDFDLNEIDINTHHGNWVITAEGTIEPGTELEDLAVVVKGQVCDDVGCINFERELVAELVTVQDLNDRSVKAPSGGAELSPPADGASKEDESSSLWAFLGQAVFWGFFTLLMPCTYPMIPITISFFTKQATQRGGRVLPLALTYGVGIIAIFIVIGLLAAPFIIRFATHPVTNLVIGGLFIFFAMTLFGFINLQPPAFMNKMAGKASMKGGYLGVFLMGATLVVTSFTCTAPFVGTLLASSASGASEGSEGVLRIVLGMGTFGLVMATPFVFLSLVPGRLQRMPKAGGWMNTLKVYMGFVELAAAFKFLSNADIVWKWNLLSNQVFLIAVIAIFVLAALYLIWQTTRSGSRSAFQYSIALLTLVFAGYLGTFLNGRPAGDIMTAILPGYHHEGLVKTFGDQRHYTRHQIVVDDLDGAFEMAKAEGKLVLLNFTGHT